MLAKAEDYETNTGLAIAECFRELGLKPMEMPACFQKYHAPFTWGKNAADSVKRVALELGGKGANIIFEDADEKGVTAIARELRELADTDVMTGLKNRAAFNKHLDVEWKRARRRGEDIIDFGLGTSLNLLSIVN